MNLIEVMGALVLLSAGTFCLVRTAPGLYKNMLYLEKKEKIFSDRQFLIFSFEKLCQSENLSSADVEDWVKQNSLLLSFDSISVAETGDNKKLKLRAIQDGENFQVMCKKNLKTGKVKEYLWEKT